MSLVMTQIVKDVQCNQASEQKNYFLDFSKINFSKTFKKMKFQYTHLLGYKFNHGFKLCDVNVITIIFMVTTLSYVRHI